MTSDEEMLLLILALSMFISYCLWVSDLPS